MCLSTRNDNEVDIKWTKKRNKDLKIQVTHIWTVTSFSYWPSR